MKTSAYKEQNLKVSGTEDVSTGAIEFVTEDERNRYLVASFPGLARAGKCVEAMELVQGNGRASWLYRMFYGFSDWLIKRNERKADEFMARFNGIRLIPRNSV